MTLLNIPGNNTPGNYTPGKSISGNDTLGNYTPGSSTPGSRLPVTILLVTIPLVTVLLVTVLLATILLVIVLLPPVSLHPPSTPQAGHVTGEGICNWHGNPSDGQLPEGTFGQAPAPAPTRYQQKCGICTCGPPGGWYSVRLSCWSGWGRSDNALIKWVEKSNPPQNRQHIVLIIISKQ